MGLVQVTIDQSTNVQHIGTHEWKRDLGGVIIPPSGTAFPSPAVAGEWFFRKDTGVAYRRNDANDTWVAQSAVPTAHTHPGSDITSQVADADTVDGQHAAAFAAATHLHAHSSLTGVSADQHHNQAHTINGPDHTGSLPHAALSGIGATDHHSNANDPTSGQKAALAGTNGTPGVGNPYVTQSDPVNTNARTPTTHGPSHGAGQADAITIAESQVTNLTSDLAAKANDSAVVHTSGNETVGGTKTFSASPSVPAPANADSAVPRSYVDSIGGGYAAGVQTVTALRAVGSSDRQDKQLRLVEDKGSIYRFDTAGTGSDDGDMVIVPSDITPPAPGRWFKTQAATQDHEALSGLQGGAVGDHRHLTTTETGYLPSSGQKAALAGTNGTPGAGNPYVTQSDPVNTNARTPTSHAPSHKAGGGDAIKLDELAAPTDVTTLNTSTGAHGLAPKLDNNAAHYLDGQGNWSTPAGSGGIFGADYQEQNSEGTSTTTSATMQDKVTLTTGALTGTYRVEFYCEIMIGTANTRHQCRLYNVTDADEMCFDDTRPVIASMYTCRSGSKRVTFAGAAKTFKIQFASQGGVATVTIRRARIELWRVS